MSSAVKAYHSSCFKAELLEKGVPWEILPFHFIDANEKDIILKIYLATKEYFCKREREGESGDLGEN